MAATFMGNRVCPGTEGPAEPDNATVIDGNATVIDDNATVIALWPSNFASGTFWLLKIIHRTTSKYTLLYSFFFLEANWINYEHSWLGL